MLLFRYSAYRFQKNNNICEYVGSLQRRYVPTDLLADIRAYNNINEQGAPARRYSTQFAMHYGNRNCYGRSAPHRCYVQQPLSNDCRMAAVQPKCQREDRFEVKNINLVSARQADISFRLGFPHDAAFVKRTYRRSNGRNKHPEQLRQLHFGHPNPVAAGRHRQPALLVYRNDFSFHRNRHY